MKSGSLQTGRKGKGSLRGGRKETCVQEGEVEDPAIHLK